MEEIPAQPPVILAMTLREAVLLRYLMDLATDHELVALRYRLHCKMSTAALNSPPSINQHEPTNS